MRKLLLLPLLVFVLAAAAPAGAADTYKSEITKAGFIPANQTIQNGDAVTWTNKDTVNHQIVADDGSFSSDVLVPGESYTHIFVDKGHLRLPRRDEARRQGDDYRPLQPFRPDQAGTSREDHVHEVDAAQGLGLEDELDR